MNIEDDTIILEIITRRDMITANITVGTNIPEKVTEVIITNGSK
jgi:hypothetical protein